MYGGLKGEAAMDFIVIISSGSIKIGPIELHGIIALLALPLIALVLLKLLKSVARGFKIGSVKVRFYRLANPKDDQNS